MTELAHIHKYYYSEEETLHVLDDINFQIDTGEFLTTMGPSGPGKSTLINLLGLINRKFEETYLFKDHEIGDFSGKELSRIRNEIVGSIFRNFSLIEILAVGENIELPLLYSGLTPKEAKDRVHEVLTRVGLPDRSKEHPKQLSGGQQQRVAITRTTVSRPSFIIADKSAGALDSRTSEGILTLFQQLNNEGVTIVLVTYDKETIEYRNRSIKVRDGEILEEVLAWSVQLFGKPPSVPF